MFDLVKSVESQSADPNLQEIAGGLNSQISTNDLEIRHCRPRAHRLQHSALRKAGRLLGSVSVGSVPAEGPDEGALFETAMWLELLSLGEHRSDA